MQSVLQSGLRILLWMFIFCALGLEAERVPAVGTSLHNMGGTILFNFMLLGVDFVWCHVLGVLVLKLAISRYRH